MSDITLKFASQEIKVRYFKDDPINSGNYQNTYFVELPQDLSNLSSNDLNQYQLDKQQDRVVQEVAILLLKIRLAKTEQEKLQIVTPWLAAITKQDVNNVEGGSPSLEEQKYFALTKSTLGALGNQSYAEIIDLLIEQGKGNQDLINNHFFKVRQSFAFNSEQYEWANEKYAALSDEGEHNPTKPGLDHKDQLNKREREEESDLEQAKKFKDKCWKALIWSAIFAVIFAALIVACLTGIITGGLAGFIMVFPGPAGLIVSGSIAVASAYGYYESKKECNQASVRGAREGSNHNEQSAQQQSVQKNSTQNSTNLQTSSEMTQPLLNKDNENQIGHDN